MTLCLNGRLEDFLLPQVISLIEVVQSSGYLEITGSGGRGEISFRRGHIVDASLGERRGELAACLMLSWSTGEFAFRRAAAEPVGDMARGNQSLCLEAMRLLDESRNLEVALTVCGEGRAPDEEGARILGAIRGGARSIAQVAEACGVPTLAAYYHVEGLERSGLVSRTAQPTGTREEDSGTKDAIRVLVVDDSEFMRRSLTRLFESDPFVEVVGVASGGAEALALLPSLRPDVISLDLHMPDMDGITTLKRIMLTHPTPTVIVTAASPDALDLTFDSILRFGAIDFITKPSRSRGDIQEQARYILRRLRGAARVNLRGLRLFQPRLSPVVRRAAPAPAEALLIAVGGTGGCLAFLQMLASLAPELPFGILGILPFPDEFLRAFVSYMGRYSAFHVRLAEDGVALTSGVCYLTNRTGPLRIVAAEGGAILRRSALHGPCDTNLLLYDGTQAFGSRTVGLLLSSESRDWTSGLAAVRAAGGLTMAQLPETCVDPEGPTGALRQGAVDRVAVLNRLSHDLSQFFIDRFAHAEGAGTATEGAETWPRSDA
jgi:two-component system, chemotaxis family, protein-glutamate methylesterase/glutaminase